MNSLVCSGFLRGRAPRKTSPVVPLRVTSSPCLEDLAADLDRLGFVVDVEGFAADDAALAPAAGDDGRVGGLAAGRGEDALGGEHAADVLGAGLAADEDDLDALLRLLFGVGGVEAELAGGGAGDGVDARGDLELLELRAADGWPRR